MDHHNKRRTDNQKDVMKQKLARRVGGCTCAHLLVHFPRLRVDGATQQIKQRHEETEIGLLLGVVDRVVPAASREGPASCMRVTQCISTRKAPGQNHKSLKGIQLSFST